MNKFKTLRSAKKETYKQDLEALPKKKHTSKTFAALRKKKHKSKTLRLCLKLRKPLKRLDRNFLKCRICGILLGELKYGSLLKTSVIKF